MEIHTYMCIYVFAFSMKTSISRKIASDHNPPALKGTCVLTLDFSSQSVSFVNVVPISQRAARKSCLVSPASSEGGLRLFSCFVAMEITKGTAGCSLSHRQPAQSGGNMLLSGSGYLEIGNLGHDGHVIARLALQVQSYRTIDQSY